MPIRLNPPRSFNLIATVVLLDEMGIERVYVRYTRTWIPRAIFVIVTG